MNRYMIAREHGVFGTIRDVISFQLWEADLASALCKIYSFISLV